MRTVLAAILMLAVAAAQGQMATAYQINPAHTGAVDLGSELKFPLVKKWAVTLPDALSYPLIAKGKVYVLSRGISGGSGTQLFCLNGATGAIVWQSDVPSNSYWGALTYGDGRVFAIGGTGVLRAYDAVTGKIAWSKQLAGQWSFSSPPTYVGGKILVSGAGSGGTLYAVSGGNGRVLWTQSVANGDMNSPAVSNSTVYVSYAGNQAYAFRLSDGKSIWHYNSGISGGGGKTAVLSKNVLHTRDFNGNLLINARTGEIVGNYSSAVTPTFFSGARVSVWNNVVTAESETDGRRLWSFQGDKNIVTAPLFVNGFVIVGSSSGMVYALKRPNGRPAWSAGLGANIVGPDEQNSSRPLTGLAAAEGLILIPAGNTLFAYVSGK